MSPLLLAAVPAAIAFAVWALVDLEHFVMIVVLAACVYPATIAKPGGANVAAVDVFLIMALVSWLANNAVGNAPDPVVRNNRLILAGIAFAGLQWISLIWSVSPHSTIKFGIQALELCVFCPVLFSSLPRSLDAIEQGIRSVLILTAVMGVWLLVAFARNPHSQLIGTYLPGLQKNAAGSFQAVGIVVAYSFLLRKETRRAWLVAALLINVGGLVVSESRGAILGAVIGLMFVSFLMGRGKLASLALVATLAALYFSVIAPGEAAKTVQAGSYSSSQARIALWKVAVQKIEAKPFLGSGGGTYDDKEHGQPDPNNTILLTWAEDGVPGLLVLGYLFVAFGRTVARTYRRADPRAVTLTAAAGGAVITLFAHFEVDVTWARGASTLAMAMIGVALAVDRLAGIRPDEQATPVVAELPPLVLTET